MRARYPANMAKALEVVLWLADKDPEIDFHKILKLLFFADKYHLNKYGRPIVGGTYLADIYGPVSQPVYLILREEPLTAEMLERNGEPPFKVVSRYKVRAERSANRRLLSASDAEALDHAHRLYGHLSFREITELSHDEFAYQNADGGEMRYEDFLEDGPDREERAEDLAEVSRRSLV